MKVFAKKTKSFYGTLKKKKKKIISTDKQNIPAKTKATKKSHACNIKYEIPLSISYNM